MKKILHIIFLLLSVGLHAQQTPVQTQQMFNVLVYNPAYAGIHETMELSLSNRTQWLGLDGAPRTYNFTAHSGLKDQKFAVGLNVQYDKIGVTKNTTISPSLAYRVRFANNTKLAFGIQMGFVNHVAQFSDVTTTLQGDEALSGNLNRWMYNMGSGIFLYQKDWFIGLSAPKLFNNLFDPNLKENLNVKNYGVVARNYFLTGGYVFSLGNNFTIKPNILIDYSEGTYLQTNLNTNVYWKRNIGLGTSYRVNESISFLVEFFIKENTQIGYSYDYSVSKISAISSGSHEIYIGYRLPFDKVKSISPRYF